MRKKDWVEPLAAAFAAVPLDNDDFLIIDSALKLYADSVDAMDVLHPSAEARAHGQRALALREPVMIARARRAWAETSPQ